MPNILNTLGVGWGTLRRRGGCGKVWELFPYLSSWHPPSAIRFFADSFLEMPRSARVGGAVTDGDRTSLVCCRLRFGRFLAFFNTSGIEEWRLPPSRPVPATP